MASTVTQTLPFSVTIVRWWRSSVILLLLANQAISLAPIALNSLAGLGLTPVQLLLWTIGVNVVLNMSTIYVHYRSTAMIGDKTDVAVASLAPQPTPVSP